MKAKIHFFKGILLLSVLISLQVSFAQEVYINEIMASNSNTISDEDDDYEDWIELYNAGTSRISLDGFGLSDDHERPHRWVLGDVDLDPGEFMLVWASGKDQPEPHEDNNLHANYSIGSSGESVILTDPDGELLDEITFADLPSDVSYGSYPNGDGDMHIFTEPTPQSPNSEVHFQDQVNPPEFSELGGFYNNTLTLEITADNQAAAIYYTTDGSAPDQSSNKYEGALQINSTIIIRAVAYVNENLPSEIVTQSYFFERKPELPVISLVTDPDHLFSSETGIYANPRERSVDWERPINLELFTHDGTPNFNKAAGARMHGGWSRTLPQKTFRIYARNQYSDRTFYYPFTNGGLSNYRRFLLRNSGNDWASTMMRDALMQSLMQGTSLDTQGYQPAVVHLNGEYWGIHNIRERFDKHYLEAAHNVDPDNIDILEQTGGGLPYNVEVIEGSNAHYGDMIDFIENSDMSEDSALNELSEMMDISNFNNYQISQIYYGNYDWPWNNYKLWRERTDFGKWRFLLYDTDYGYMLYRDRHDQGVDWNNDYTHNSLEYAASGSGQSDYPYRGNPQWATFLLHNLLKNEEFKNNFITLFSDYLNTRFQQEQVSRQIKKMAGTIEPEIPFHAERWGGHDGGGGLVSFSSMGEWESNVDDLYEYAQNRPQHVFDHIKSQFDLDELSKVSLDISHNHKGYLKVNSISIQESSFGVPENPYPWEGNYFRDLPIQVVAKPYPGYKLAAWEGIEGNANSDTLNLILTEDLNLTAVFEKDESFDENTFIPSPHRLKADEYSFFTWSSDEPAGTYPPNMRFQYMAEDDPPFGAEAEGYTDGAYNLVSRTRLVGHGDDGFSFINTSNSDGNPGYPGNRLGAAILGLDTRGVDNVTVSWKGGTVQPNSRVYNLRLQYRIGNDGPFTDVKDQYGKPVEYFRNEQPGHIKQFDPVQLPAEAGNKSYVQLRWVYYFTGQRIDDASGQRSQLNISEIIVKDQLLSSEGESLLPEGFGLTQNYPNPFNSATAITYRLPESADISLEVFNIQGRRVAVLESGWNSVGEHTISFDASNLASGVYIYRLIADGYIESKKMILLK